MRVTLEINDETVREILLLSAEQLDDAGEPLPFDEFVESLLNDALERKKKDVMNDDEIDRTVESMLRYALRNEVSVFKTSELYAKATSDPWVKLAPSIRKSIGKRFRTAIGVHADTARHGDPIIVFEERNINNAALYRVAEKAE